MKPGKPGAGINRFNRYPGHAVEVRRRLRRRETWRRRVEIAFDVLMIAGVMAFVLWAVAVGSERSEQLRRAACPNAPCFREGGRYAD